MKTNNKLIMDFVVEHVIAVKRSMTELKKIDKARKYERVMLPCEISDSIGVTLISCGKDTK